MLDFVYTNIKSAYRAAPLPHIGSSDHLTVILQPAYRVWPQDALPALHDCFECTQWSIFREAASSGDFIGLQEYTEAVMGFISKCVDDVAVLKTCATNKPWLTVADGSFNLEDTRFCL